MLCNCILYTKMCKNINTNIFTFTICAFIYFFFYYVTVYDNYTIKHMTLKMKTAS